jgi:multidrug resistance efflux pump
MSAFPDVDTVEPVDGELLDAWFQLLCRMLPAPGDAAVVAVSSGRRGPTLLSHPRGSESPTAVLAVAEQVADTGAPVTQNSIFGHPLRHQGRVFAALAIELNVDDAQQAVVLHLLEWGERWLHLLLDSVTARPSESTVVGEPDGLTELLREVLAAGTRDAALLTVADHLSQRFECERVAIGLRIGGKLRLQALSHGMQFDARTQLARAYSEAMQRVHETGSCVWPVEASYTDHSLSDLAQAVGEHALLAVRLDRIGAVILERPADRQFSTADQHDLEAIATLLSTVFELQLAQSAWLPPRLHATGGALLNRMFGTGHRVFKAGVATLLVALLCLSVVEGNYRVRATASIEGMVQRAVVAPFDGFIAEATHRAGDTVLAGDVIARMEDRELRLELSKSASEEEKLENEYRKALAAADRSEALMVQARLSQVQAQSRLFREQLERVALSAPVEGVIISGDLSHALGAPVERGEVLFEVAPLDEYRLVLEIEEADIAHVAAGQRGLLTLTALPNERLKFEVQRVSPVFLEQEGRVVYRTEAQIEGDASMLRPGMEGVGKIEVGDASYGWIFFHRLLDWFRLRLWLWLP